MSNKQDFTRRALLTGAGTAVASAALGAAIVPALAKTEAAPTVGDEQLGAMMHRISEILDTAAMGTFCAVIEPSQYHQATVALKPVNDVRKALATANFLDQAPPSELVEYHLRELTKAMRRQHGGCWVGRVAHGGLCITVSEEQASKPGAWVSFPIGE
jgi:hypothetical protein